MNEITKLPENATREEVIEAILKLPSTVIIGSYALTVYKKDSDIDVCVSQEELYYLLPEYWYTSLIEEGEGEYAEDDLTLHNAWHNRVSLKYIHNDTLRDIDLIVYEGPRQIQYLLSHKEAVREMKKLSLPILRHKPSRVSVYHALFKSFVRFNVYGDLKR